MDTKLTIATQKNIRIEMIRADVSQVELAELAGVTPSFICHILSGRKKPSKRVSRAIAKRLGINLLPPKGSA